MSTVKFRKVPELFPNRKVRTVRTEQLWSERCRACATQFTHELNFSRVGWSRCRDGCGSWWALAASSASAWIIAPIIRCIRLELEPDCTLIEGHEWQSHDSDISGQQRGSGRGQGTGAIVCKQSSLLLTVRKVLCNYWRYVALVVVLWRPALSASSSPSVTALRWEPVNVHV